MKNTEIKPILLESIPQLLNGDMSRCKEVADLLCEYTWTYSRLKSLMKSHKSFLFDIVKPYTPTDATILGDLIHKIALDQPMDNVVFERIDGRTREGKVRKAEVLELGLTVLDPKLKKKADNCVRALKTHKEARIAFEVEGNKEVWLFGKAHGFKIGGYVDKESKDTVFELKTSSDCSHDKCQRDFIDRCYTLQESIYRALTGKQVYYPVVETSEPHNVSMFKPSPDYQAHGDMLLSKCLEELSNLITNLYDGIIYSYGENKVQHLQIPAWEKKKLDYWRENN